MNMLVSELTTNMLPQAFLDCLPKTCPFCGHPTEITPSLSALTCTNPLCKAKLNERMVAMLADLGVKNLGSSKCQSFIDKYNLNSPYAIFAWAKKDGTATSPLYDGCSKEFSDSIAVQVNAKRNKMLWEYVKIGNFPGIRDSAKKIFSDYETVEAFYKDFEDPVNGGMPFIAKKLGIKSDNENISIKAADVTSVLKQIKKELLTYEKYFDIIRGVSSINICLSTAVGKPYTSKADFVDKMNRAYGANMHINQLSGVTQSCNCLIWSKQGGKTSKVQKAEKYGIPILTGRAFDLAMQEIVKGADIAETCKAYQQKENSGTL